MNRSCNMSKCPRSSSSVSSSGRSLRNLARIRERSTRSMSLPLAVQPQHAADYTRDPLPAPGFTRQLFAAGAGDRVKLCSPVAVRRAPFRLDPALLRQAQQRGVDGALVQPKQIMADLLDSSCDAIAVLRAQGIQRLED